VRRRAEHLTPGPSPLSRPPPAGRGGNFGRRGALSGALGMEPAQRIAWRGEQVASLPTQKRAEVFGRGFIDGRGGRSWERKESAGAARLLTAGGRGATFGPRRGRHLRRGPAWSRNVVPTSRRRSKRSQRDEEEDTVDDDSQDERTNRRLHPRRDIRKRTNRCTS
jgi:hypothetical protein